MAIEIWLAFVITCTVLLIIPGPTILTVISYSIAHGRRANIPVIAGVAAGDATALFFSLVGLGAILSTSAWAFTLIKTVGGLYLVYLGLKLMLSKASPLNRDSAATLESSRALFFNTWLVTALNPKGIIFFIAFLPQFVDQSHSVVQQLWILSITFVVLATLNAALYAAFALSARKLMSSPKARRRFNLGGGSLLGLAGGWALLAKSPS